MQKQLVEMPVQSVSVRQIVATTSKWIHVLGSDESLYLVPAVPRNYSYEHAYCDSVILNALGIATLDAEVLSLSRDLALKAGLTANAELKSVRKQVIGWRLPKEEAGSRVVEILPSSWLRRVNNREQFLEVLILDLWFQRSGQRQVVFEQTGQKIRAIFLPSGNLDGIGRCTFEQVGYKQTAVYTGLAWAGIEARLKAKVASLSLSDLGRQLRGMPEIGVGHRVLKSLWFAIEVNKVCFHQSLSRAMRAIFGGVVYNNHDRAFEISTNRLCAVSNERRGYSMGSRCG